MRLRKRFYLVFVAILVLSLVLTSCDSIDISEDSSQVTIENEKPSAGGTLTMGSVEPKELNPLTVNSKSFLDASRLMFEPLAEYDGTLKLVPVIAQQWSFDQGTSKFTINLKNDLYWSDGGKITSSDVVFSLDTIKTSETSAFKDKLEHVYSYKAESENTITIVFDQAYANALDILTIPIIPEHVLKLNPNAVPPVSGPYKISNYEKLKQMELVPNDKWIRLGSVEANGTKPYIERISIQFINDLDAFSTAFQAKELDVLHTQSYDWEKYSELKDVKTYKYTSLYYDFIGFNYNNSIFQDKAVRKAMLTAINRRGIIDKYLLGNAVLTDVPVHPDSWLYDGKAANSSSSKVNATNLLEQAGFEDANNDKILERKYDDLLQTLKFTLLTNSENEFRVKAAEEIKKNLEEVGFSVDLKIVTFEEMKTAIATKQFDAVLTGYNLSPNQDLSFAFHSSQIVGGGNFMSYSNLDMDNNLYQAYISTNDNTRKEMYAKIQETFREEVPCISLFFRDSAVVVRDKVKGEISPDATNPYRGIQGWFISKDKR
ncbi:MAG: extracellular solute-binding protein family 5 [Clostridia bacterium]|jgi:peptide/nickel transport system substrate-binding protein|nr:extracellular solute-binding protein family 5 [Clostridia bacterium]